MEKVSIVFNGRVYSRFPSSKNYSDRVYFKSKGKIYHRELYESIHGLIPEDHEIHHDDFNPLNNSPDNLKCLHKDDHATIHANERRGKCTDKQRAHLEEIRPLTKVWHSSEEGKQWHSEHAKKVFGKIQPVMKVCETCEQKYDTKNPHSRFCASKCRAKWRRDTGIDDESRICEHCKKDYMINRYYKNRFCSNSCRAKNTHST